MKVNFRFNGEPYEAEGTFDLSPDPDWPTATCGECGWWYERTEVKRRHVGMQEAPDPRFPIHHQEIIDWGCRRTGPFKIDPEYQACVAFVRRPKEAPDA